VFMRGKQVPTVHSSRSCACHSRRTTHVRVSPSTEVESRFSAVIPHTLVFVVQRGTPQTKGRSCTSTRSRQQTRHILQPCLAGPSPGDDQGTLEAGRGGRWERAVAGLKPECVRTHLGSCFLPRRQQRHSSCVTVAAVDVVADKVAVAAAGAAAAAAASAARRHGCSGTSRRPLTAFDVGPATPPASARRLS
jgi:hypothetical protein